LKFCVIVGTRPQIIKTQPIINEILKTNSKLSIIHTGQHYDFKMSQSFFNELDIRKPDLNLNIKPKSSSQQLGEIIMKLEKPLSKIDPDIVIVPGDTKSALGAALSANRLGIKLAHIEAGARSMEYYMEEEINRRLIDHCSNYLFAPTKNCFNNLQKESVLGKIFYSGDTMYDIFLKFEKILKLSTQHRDVITATLHRKENIHNVNNLKNFISLIKKLSKKNKVIFPLHPHTKKMIQKNNISLKGITTRNPLKYSEMLQLLSKSKLLLTDSGGLQKEAYWTKTPCVTFRKSTEWIETLDGKNNLLLKIIDNSNLNKIEKIIEKKSPSSVKKSKTFGDGNASKKIISILRKQI
jgi:UDP-GlcNAc3NAcA epimerase